MKPSSAEGSVVHKRAGNAHDKHRVRVPIRRQAGRQGLLTFPGKVVACKRNRCSREIHRIAIGLAHHLDDIGVEEILRFDQSMPDRGNVCSTVCQLLRRCSHQFRIVGGSSAWTLTTMVSSPHPRCSTTSAKRSVPVWMIGTCHLAGLCSFCSGKHISIIRGHPDFYRPRKGRRAPRLAPP